jgi:ABC-2 type transport system permease protein
MAISDAERKLRRVYALITYDFAITWESKWHLVEMFYFPITTLLIWGLFAKYAGSSGGFAEEAAYAILIVQIFWSFSSLSQSTITSQMMEDVWSGGIRELLITPLKPHEFLLARCFTAVWKSVIILLVLIFGGYYLFGISFMLNEPGFVLALSVLSLVVSIGIGVIIAALIIHLGVGYGFLSWSLLSLFMLLSAPFYPLSVFPEPVLTVAKFMPYTWIFESIRSYVSTRVVDTSLLINAAVLTLAYFSVSFPLFSWVFRRARQKGRLVRLWE